MNKTEIERLISIIYDIEESDDKIEPLERLLAEVKKLIKYDNYNNSKL